MRIRDYFKDKMLFLLVNFLVFFIVMVVMEIIEVSLTMIFMVFCIWFLPLLSYMLIEGIKTKLYYDEINKTLSALDKKYLLPEVLEEANFIEGRIVGDILKEISRDMHENVKYYRDIQEEYREYIEMWVHEIKTPIASTKLIIENNKNDVTNKIDTQMDRIEGFVEQVLYYSRSDEVGKDYIIKEFKLENVVNRVLKRNFRDFINKGIRPKIGEINGVVYTDEKWVEFIINQIVVNSIKYSKGKDAYISIKSRIEKNSIVLEIEDNGVGIEAQDISRVFEKGFTGENGRKFGKSTGMGLYLCKKLCKKLGLSLNLSSESGVGTRVEIVFPIGREVEMLSM